MNTAATFVLTIVILVCISISYLTNQRSQSYVVPILSRSDLFDDIELEQEKRREILERGCRVAGDLDQLIKNETAYDTLLKLHRRIHNLRRDTDNLLCHLIVVQMTITLKRSTVATSEVMS